MPMTIWLDRDIEKLLDSSKLTEIYNSVIGIIRDLFGFRPEKIEVWRGGTSEVLGGVLERKVGWEDLKNQNTMLSIIEEMTSTEKALIITGSCYETDPGSKIEIYGNSSLRRIYSDIFFDTGDGLYDRILTNHEAYNALFSLQDRLSGVETVVNSVVEGRRKIQRRKVVTKAYISNNVPDVDNKLGESTLLYTYFPKGPEFTFLRLVLNNVANELKNPKAPNPFSLYNFKSMARAISEFSIKKGYNIEKYATMQHGSIVYIAKEGDTLNRLFDDFSEKIARPVLTRISKEFEFNKILEEEVTETGPGSIHDYEK